ncbi:MAG: hypothetical protein GWN99_01610 [Gemmatimonadetes bacterium]|uniref:Uncharacterized protein n=1 Tax=Candidatus Kutchimonas denitrificans TaxID=3056748 RepID=A0AAE4Z5J8_9BACT|nr:hypothetical protein [Gemmatimonadota bacterium]NIR73958.1 hypothetical protein [Candidatus Kutchimonas denitrificans]NIR99764.1 hypothetical protein [Gemmatimonadota bacterium]NIT65349.1 hypothetical protein [Gemmatimonadota bacterium]NIW73798.1 hypothetical protein [Gemmatimonadota bacterium]
MEISVRDVLAKPEWVYKLSAFLHDAVALEAFSYDEASSTFSLPLYRISYEYRRHKRLLWLINSWVMPKVPCVLSIRPVRIAKAPFADEKSRLNDQLLGFGVSGDGSIDLMFRYSSIVLKCVDTASMLLSDTGEPTWNMRTTDFGRLLLSEDLIGEVLGTSET